MSFYHMHRFTYHHNQDAELVHHPKEATEKPLCLPTERGVVPGNGESAANVSQPDISQVSPGSNIPLLLLLVLFS